MRYATLVVEKLPQHPEAREPEGKRALKTTGKTMPDVFARLETLRPGIDNRYNTWKTALARQKEAKSAVNTERATSRDQLSLDFAATDPAIAGNSTTLAAADHGDLAVRLAHKEIRRRNAARRGTRQAGISEEEEQERRAAGLWDNWDTAIPNYDRYGDEGELREHMEDARRRAPGAGNMGADGRSRLSKINRKPVRPEPSLRVSGNYSYPSVSKPRSLTYEDWASPPPAPAALPPRPPKERSMDTAGYHQDNGLPVKPPKQPHDEPDHVSTSPTEAATEPFTFRPSAYLENGSPLRTVFLPPTLRQEFLRYAAANTRDNLETCGILCGTLISNALFISRLVIPEQKATSDTCETTDEGALFDYCDSEDLMVLGWIHTHPSQTCFMSSRDLHTHCGYQVMMPESIAIVCAPSKTPS